MSMDDDLNFGVTLDNGDDDQGPQTDRKLKPAQPKIEIQKSNSNTQFSVGRQDYDLKRAEHPRVCLATILFKAAAFFIYFFMGILISRVLIFIMVTILGALDFWVVKNISGRILVGLRWWSAYDEKGNQVWKFQTHSKQFHANPIDKKFFWSAQILGTLVWGVFLIINVLGLDIFDSLQVGINFMFCATNLYGFYQCNGEYSKKLGNIKRSLGQRGLMTFASRFV